MVRCRKGMSAPYVLCIAPESCCESVNSEGLTHGTQALPCLVHIKRANQALSHMSSIISIRESLRTDIGGKVGAATPTATSNAGW